MPITVPIRRFRLHLHCSALCLAGALLLLPAQSLAAREAGPLNLASALALDGVADDLAKVDRSGRFVVYLETATARGNRIGAELWRVPVAGGESQRLSGSMAAGESVAAFAVSPDGRWVAYTTAQAGHAAAPAAAEVGARQLFVVALAGGSPRRLAATASRDGQAGTCPGIDQFAFDGESRRLAFGDHGGCGGEVVLVEEVFSEDFEGGDASGWSDITPNPCPTPSGGPTLHSSVVANQTWTANTSPHIVTANILVPAGVTLTVAPCAEVRIRPGFELTVQGTLVARGTPTQRITVRRDNPSLPWDSIWAKSSGFADLAFVDLFGGGAAGAAVVAEGSGLHPAALPLRADHLKVVGSTSLGVRLFQRAGFAAGSRDLVVSGSGATDPGAPYPVRMPLITVGTLPTGTYTGNASDLISINEGNHVVEVDAAFHDRGIPYQIGGPAATLGVLTIDGDPALATLTIDAGVEIRFFTAGSNIGGLFVGTSGSPVATGRLVAQGTAIRPVLFTGAGGAAVAGDWEGITFFGALAAGNLLDHVRIDAAGDNGGDAGFGCPPAAFPETSGALKIFSQPATSFLTNSTISRSSTHGIFRAWEGTEVDFMAGNSFSEVLFCDQVLNRPTPPGVCPANPPCPQ